MKKIIIVFVLLGMYSTAYTQHIHVKDADTGEDIEGVAIVNENQLALITDAFGNADISLFKNSKRIELRMLGYKTIVKSYDAMESLNFDIRLFPSHISIDKAVVSASRWSQSNTDVPSKITTISAKAIELQNPQTAADLLSGSGEVFVQKSQSGGGSPMIRGFATNRLLLSVDGVRMNTAIFRSGNIQNVLSIDPFAIEHTEVLFGPGSVIYGSDAIGGVMSFHTLKAHLSTNDEIYIKGNATTRYSSANAEQTNHFDINIGTRKWAFVSSFSQFNFGDLRMGRKGPDEYLRPFYVQRMDSVDIVVQNDDPLKQHPTAYQQTNLMQKIRFKPNTQWDINYAFHYSATGDYSRYDRLTNLRNGLPRSAEWKYGPQIWMMNNLTLIHKSDFKLYDELTVRLAHQYFEESRIDRNFNSNNRFHRIEKVNAYSSNFDFAKKINEKHLFFYGLEFVLNDIESIGIDDDISMNTKVAGAARYPRSTWNSNAVYLNYQYKFSEKILMQGGVRYNQFSIDASFDTSFYPFPYTEAKINNNALTGSLGFVFNPNEKLNMSINISSGFRSPNIDDMGKVFDSEPGTVIVPNPDLSAENAYNIDFGLAKVFGNSFKVDFTAFYTVLQDAMVRRDFTLAGMDSIMFDGEMSKVEAIQNAAHATVYGVQAGAEWKLPEGFTIISRFNYQLGEEELDNGNVSPLRHAAPWFGMSHLTFTHQKVKLDLYAIYNGEKSFNNLADEERSKPYLYARDANGNPYAPAWYTLNFKAMYDLNSTFSILAGLENITDQRYRTYSSGISAAGRNAVFALKARF